MIRALEVFDKTGYSILTPKEKPARLYDYYLLGLKQIALYYMNVLISGWIK